MIKLTNILSERSGLVAKTKIGSFNIHVVLNMSKLFLRIEKRGRVWTATLDGWNSGDANKFLDKLDDKSVTALTKKLKDVDHPKYNSLNKHGKVTVMKLKLSQQTLGRESVNEGVPIPTDTPNEFAYLELRNGHLRNEVRLKNKWLL